MTKLKLSDYMLIAEAANFLGVAQNTLRKWADQGKVNTRRHPINGYRLFRRRDLDAVLKQTSDTGHGKNKQRSKKKPR